MERNFNEDRCLKWIVRFILEFYFGARTYFAKDIFRDTIIKSSLYFWFIYEVNHGLVIKYFVKLFFDWIKNKSIMNTIDDTQLMDLLFTRYVKRCYFRKTRPFPIIIMASKLFFSRNRFLLWHLNKPIISNAFLCMMHENKLWLFIKAQSHNMDCRLVPILALSSFFFIIEVSLFSLFVSQNESQWNEP